MQCWIGLKVKEEDEAAAVEGDWKFAAMVIGSSHILRQTHTTSVLKQNYPSRPVGEEMPIQKLRIAFGFGVV